MFPLFGYATNVRAPVKNVIYALKLRAGLATACKSQQSKTDGIGLIRLAKANILGDMGRVNVQVSQHLTVSCVAIVLES